MEDIQAIAEFIGKDSAFYARAVVSKILNSAKSLGEFPTIGRIVPEYDNKNLRERFIHSYRMIYQIHGGKITIIAIIHGKRMLEPVATERIKIEGS